MEPIVSNPYNPFPTVIFRSPYLSLNLFIKWLSDLDKSPGYLTEILALPDIQEAILLASPVLYKETFKYLEDCLVPKEKEKFFFSALKYLSRMATRCTPFGLFAGCSAGQIAAHTNILIPDTKHYSRCTRFDMDYLCALAQDIAKKEEIRKRLFFYPNNSNYVVGDTLRYVEYQYLHGRRKHNIVAIQNTDYLKRLISNSINGATIEQLATLLIDDEISSEEAKDFINDIIDNQLFVSELEPSVTGPAFLDQLIHSLEKFDSQQELIYQLRSLAHLLQKIDYEQIGCAIPLYTHLKEQIALLGTSFSEKHLFQSDMIKRCESSEVDKKIIDEVLQAITFLNKISLSVKQETLLDHFADSFYERFEEREVSLAKLLDTEMGLSFNKSNSEGDRSPLIEGIPFRSKNQENPSHTWSTIQSLLHRKVAEALTDKRQEITLTDDDVKDVNPKWDDMPHTIAAMCEIFSYNSNGQSTLFLHPIGGSSAANLLGRFCHTDENIHKLVLDIVREEEKVLPEDKLYAEIVHLPESRTGNILARPLLHSHEIPYLAKSGVGKEFQLEVSDLMVSVRQRKFVLRSKRLNKEIIPRLTTAHNYSQPGTMPIYQFLCSLQNQHHRRGIGLILSGLFNEFPYLPRIVYKNTILSLARWLVKPSEIKQIVEGKDMEATDERFKQWKACIGIPRFVVIPDGDNELFIDTESLISLRMLYSVVKKRPIFTLQEFPFDMEHTILKNDTGVFANEFLFTFYKKQPD